MNCLTQFRWATEALENPFLDCYLTSFVYFYIPYCQVINFTLLVKSSSQLIGRILTALI